MRKQGGSEGKSEEGNAYQFKKTENQRKKNKSGRESKESGSVMRV